MSIPCVDASTIVYTAGGGYDAMDLVPRRGRFDAFSWSARDGRMVAKHAEAHYAGYKPVINIVTDWGDFRVASNANLLLAGGKAIRADRLEGGDVLMGQYVPSKSPTPWMPDAPATVTVIATQSPAYRPVVMISVRSKEDHNFAIVLGDVAVFSAEE